MRQVSYSVLETELNNAKTKEFLSTGTVNIRIQKAKTEMLFEFYDCVNETTEFYQEDGFFVLKGKGCLFRIPVTEPEGKHPIFMDEETEITNPKKAPYTKAKYFLFFAGRTRTVIELYSK